MAVIFDQNDRSTCKNGYIDVGDQMCWWQARSPSSSNKILAQTRGMVEIRVREKLGLEWIKGITVTKKILSIRPKFEN